jgi:hypothetical protein
VAAFLARSEDQRELARSCLSPMFLVLFLLVRGVPMILYLKDLAKHERLPFALYCRTTLPLVVAITDIGVASAGMRVEIATAMVGAAVLSVLLFPATAQALLSSNTPTAAIAAAPPLTSLASSSAER